MENSDLELVAQEVFAALADPSRRSILATLAARGPATATDLAAQLPITRQAVSLHIQFLSDCGLVSIQKQGRERYCEARLDKLNEVSDWVEASKKVWMQRFRSLEVFLDQLDDQQTKKKRKNAKRK